MDIKYIGDKKQAQFELFPSEDWKGQGDLKRGCCRSITLSIEGIVVLCVVLVIAGVWIFSLGVKRGKRIAVMDNYDNQGSSLNVDGNAKRWSIALVNVDSNDKAVVSDASKREAGVIKTVVTNKNHLESAAADSVKIDNHQMKVSPQDRDRTIVSNDIVQTNKILEKDNKRYYTIQVASFKKEKNAKIEAERLKGKGIGVDIFVLPKGEYSIVCVGRFLKKDDAKEFSVKIKDRYKDYLIRRL